MFTLKPEGLVKWCFHIYCINSPFPGVLPCVTYLKLTLGLAILIYLLRYCIHGRFANFTVICIYFHCITRCWTCYLVYNKIGLNFKPSGHILTLWHMCSAEKIKIRQSFFCAIVFLSNWTFYAICNRIMAKIEILEGQGPHQSLCGLRPPRKKWSFSLSVSSVNLTKSAVSRGFVTFKEEILNWKHPFFVQ